MQIGIHSARIYALLVAMNATQQVRSVADDRLGGAAYVLATPRRHRDDDGITAVLSEDRVKGLVRLVERVKGRGNPQDALALPTSLPRGYSSAEDGSSGPVSPRGVDAPRYWASTH
jgi:hypothetical protein